jgi:hypothetical protein
MFSVSFGVLMLCKTLREKYNFMWNLKEAEKNFLKSRALGSFSHMNMASMGRHTVSACT